MLTYLLLKILNNIFIGFISWTAMQIIQATFLAKRKEKGRIKDVKFKI